MPSDPFAFLGATPTAAPTASPSTPLPPAQKTSGGDPFAFLGSKPAAPNPQPGSAPPVLPPTTPSKGSLLQTYSDVTDVPLNLLNASMDPMGKHRLSGSLPEAFSALTGGNIDPRTWNPHALNEQYNPTSQAYLEKTAPVLWTSSAMLHNPAARVAGSFLSESENPANWLLPGAVGLTGKALKAGAGVASKIPGVAKAAGAVSDAVMPHIDRFYGLRKVAGEEGEFLGRSMLNEKKAASVKAMEQTQDIMGPLKTTRQPGWKGILPNAKAELFPRYLTPEEKIEVLRRSTAGLEPKAVEKAGPANPDWPTYSDLSGPPEQAAQQSIIKGQPPTPDLLSQRGKAYRTAIKDMTAAKIATHPGLLPPGRVYNPEIFSPMSGQFADPNLSEDAQAYVDGLGGAGPQAGGGLKTVLGTAAQGAPHKELAHIDEVLANEAQRKAAGEPAVLRKDYDPAQALSTYLSRGGRNIAFEKGIQNAPASLAKRIEYERPKSSGQALTPKNLRIEDFAHFGKQAEEQFAKATAGMKPVVPKGWVTGEDVQKVLGSSPSAAQRVFRQEFVDFIKEAGASEPEAKGISAFFEGLNHLARISVITNPVVHIAWNLFGNYLGAKGDPARFEYIAKGTGWDEAAKWDKIGEQYGAHTHMTTHGILGGDPARVLTGGGTNPVPGVDALNRMLTRGWSSNQKLVFDTYERRFSTALFAQKAQAFKDAGMNEVEAYQRAGKEVRKAFGDYANVNTTGLEGALTKAMFFYPWLKTVIPFAAKTALKNPSWINKPVRGVQAWNQGMGDDGGESKFNHLSLGGGNMVSLPFPQRNLENALGVVAPGDAGLGGSLNAGEAMLSSHLNPFWSVVLDAINTAAHSPQQPGGVNRNTLFDKDAPWQEQLQQAAGSAAGHLPFAGLSQQSPFTLGAFPYSKDSPEKTKATHDILATMRTALAKYKAIGDRKDYDETYREFQKLLPDVTQGL